MVEKQKYSFSKDDGLAQIDWAINKVEDVFPADDDNNKENEHVLIVIEITELEALSEAEGQSGQPTGLHTLSHVPSDKLTAAVVPQELQVILLAEMSTEISQAHDPVEGVANAGILLTSSKSTALPKWPVGRGLPSIALKLLIIIRRMNV